MDAANALAAENGSLFRSGRLGSALKRAAALLVSAAIALAGLAGCAGASPEEVITSSLAGQLDKVKSLDNEFVGSIASYMDADRFKDYGVDSAAFVRAYFDGFDYAIDSVEVDGEYGHAKATLTCKSYSDFRKRLGDASDALVDNAQDYVSMSREDIARVYGDLLMETLGQVSTAPTKSVDFFYYLDDGTWVLDGNPESIIASALLTN